MFLDGESIGHAGDVVAHHASPSGLVAVLRLGEPFRWQHLGFGQAEHFCVGVHLARLEGRIFYEELLARFATIERAGEPKRLRSNLNNSYKSLPITLTPR